MRLSLIVPAVALTVGMLYGCGAHDHDVHTDESGHPYGAIYDGGLLREPRTPPGYPGDYERQRDSAYSEGQRSQGPEGNTR